MKSVFISYNRRDNESSAYGSKDHPIQHHLEQIKKAYHSTIGKELNDFFDEKDMSTGDLLLDRLKKAIDNSPVMISFISPGYLQSEFCLQEWEYFMSKDEKEALILPFIFKDVNNSIFKSFDDRQQNVYSQIQERIFLDLTKLEDDIDEREKVEMELEKISLRIHDLCFNENNGYNNTNIQTFDLAIDKSKNNTLIIEDLSSRLRLHKESDPICVIYTGGSVGMVRNKSLDSEDDELIIAENVVEIKNKIPRLSELPSDIHFFSYKEPIDSSNIEVSDWLKLAGIIKLLYKHYDGFVILHGANTLSYTAAALSFIFDNLGKPVILTGSELPLVELGSDASSNIIGAIKAASHNSKNGPLKVPEVCVFYGNRLFRGNRTTKKHSLDTKEGFYSPNIEPIGEYKSSKLSISKIRKQKPNHYDDIINYSGFDVNGVFILEIYPGIDFEWYKVSFKKMAIKGLVLKSYTTGNVPESDSFVSLISYLLDKGVIIVNITQCPIGHVELRLFETNAKMFDMGVVNGGDMTVEAAYCKLKYLIGRYGDHIKHSESIKNKFQIDLRGEMSLSAYSIFSSNEELNSNDNQIYTTKDKAFGGQFDFDDIDNAFIRLQGIRILNNPNNLPPEFSIYYNRPNIGLQENHQDIRFRLAHFKKSINLNIEFNKNIEVTHRIRKLYLPDQDIMLSLIGHGDIEFSIGSIKLIVYTKSN